MQTQCRRNHSTQELTTRNRFICFLRRYLSGWLHLFLIFAVAGSIALNDCWVMCAAQWAVLAQLYEISTRCSLCTLYSQPVSASATNSVRRTSWLLSLGWTNLSNVSPSWVHQSKLISIANWHIDCVLGAADSKLQILSCCQQPKPDCVKMSDLASPNSREDGRQLGDSSLENTMQLPSSSTVGTMVVLMRKS